MPAYHSKRNEDRNEEVCSCAICPLKTELKGPAPLFSPTGPDDDEDIIDETLNYFRANVLFRNFEVIRF
jgi:actin related protein 2/3 complex subunit 3